MSEELRKLLNECAALDKSATPGPWEWEDQEDGEAWLKHDTSPDDGDLMLVAEAEYVYPNDTDDALDPDAAFIARSRDLLPRLARALRAVVEECGNPGSDIAEVWDPTSKHATAKVASILAAAERAAGEE